MRLRLPLKYVSVVFLTFSLTISLPSLSAAQAQAPASTSPAAASPLDSHDASRAKTDGYQEDFSSLTLVGSQFFPLQPALGQADNDPQSTFTRERWQLMWRPSDPLDLYICKPKGVSRPPVILYLYGYPTDAERYKDDNWCSTTTAGGFAAVGFLSASTGDRLEMHPFGLTFFGEFQKTLGASVHDVEMILNYLSARGDLDMSTVGMFGEGTGGSIAILASAADPRIKALDLLTPWGGWPELFATSPSVSKEKRAKFTSAEFLATVANLDPVNWLPHIQAKNLRMQDVLSAGAMPTALEERMEAAAPETAVINQYGDGAAFASHNPGGALPLWLQDQLRPNPKALMAKDKAERIHTFPAEALANPLPPVPISKKAEPAKN